MTKSIEEQLAEFLRLHIESIEGSDYEEGGIFEDFDPIGSQIACVTGAFAIDGTSYRMPPDILSLHLKDGMRYEVRISVIQVSLRPTTPETVGV